MKHPMIAALATASLLAPPLHAAEATTEVKDRDGNDLGAVHVRDMPSGIALATVTLTGLPEGIHAIHLHETGDCQSEDFSSAGEHIAGDRAHGVLTEDGPHPGDMPNLTVKENGIGEIEVFLPFLEVERDILDEDGAAFVMHEGVDDYESQPSGNAGDRIACGAFSVRE
ncbi:superoxide dismutase, Cu-Zn family [Lutimaribacter pacificus]|uniref:Superoxide dismutase, Cu-Zn family n=1 Tax=Lutimaribacter pacificus TaxID=391948 RepID=A0A1H0LUT6_9RHOB|nr:superoxide dismutase family protein [Lutimaribacter pacificus]SDO71917.1 superoxide dismutase, Cu-Zn family [Lutimaribacter pacificus]SHK02997.1 superoxide dismutase, Cu-Zn family [Lutimaribacter pacificus]